MSEKGKKISCQTILGIVLCIVFIPVIILNVMLIISIYLHPGEMPGVLGIKPVIVLSGSMEPEISAGDLILLHKADTKELQEGDVICYLASKKAVTHRIKTILTGEDGLPRFITQGDANRVEDRLAVTADQVEGIWKGQRIGGLGAAFMNMQTPTGMMVMMLLPFLLFVFWDIHLRKKADREEYLLSEQRRAKLEEELEGMKRQIQETPPCAKAEDGTSDN